MSTDRYKNSKIYKLVNDVDDQIYIGSTTTTLADRLSHHKKDARKCPARSVCKHLNEVGWDKVCIVCLEEYPCENVTELHNRERYWIEKLQPQLNMTIPGRSKQERNRLYYQANKEKCDTRIRAWRTANREHYLQQKREYDKSQRLHKIG